MPRGRPEEALAAARRETTFEAAAAYHGYRIAGIQIVDVRTGERWAVPV